MDYGLADEDPASPRDRYESSFSESQQYARPADASPPASSPAVTNGRINFAADPIGGEDAEDEGEDGSSASLTS